MCTNSNLIRKDGKYKETTYKGKQGEKYDIECFSKCGSCKQCIANKANNWVIRNYYEAKKWEKKCFVTLTYKENPIFLIKKDLQDFLKRFRRYIEYNGYKEKIRFYASGEYGEINNRPHYHIIIYNWEETNDKLIYKGVNKKKNIIMESKTINKVWGKGRTSIQKFDSHEIPYISLYNTPQETFKKAYKISREKAKELAEMLKKSIKTKIQYKTQRINQLITIQNAIKKAEKEKKKYIQIKEFNTWSTALGWEEFAKQYTSNYIFKEYIEDKEFLTPSSWVKKMANCGEINAIEEMKKRAQYEIEKGITAEMKNAKERINEKTKESKEIIKYYDDKKAKIEDF